MLQITSVYYNLGFIFIAVAIISVYYDNTELAYVMRCGNTATLLKQLQETWVVRWLHSDKTQQFSQII